MSEHIENLRKLGKAFEMIVEKFPDTDMVQHAHRDAYHCYAAADHMEALEATLRASTKLLRGIRRHLYDAMTEDEAIESCNQIAANEAALKESK